MNKKIGIILSIVATLVLISAIAFFVIVVKPINDAKKEYNNVKGTIVQQNKELEEKISKLQELLNAEAKPVDETLIEKSKELINKAENKKYKLAEEPKTKEEYIEKTNKLKEVKIDYSSEVFELEKMKNEYELSVNAYKNFVKPSAEFIIARLSKINQVTKSEAVTEENDPMNLLNKPGRYIADVYFESKNIKVGEFDSSFLRESTIKKGTDGGGAIEVYSTEEEAIKRVEYLKKFDGTFIDPGEEKAVGTVVIRVSSKLTASDQKELIKEIIKAFSEKE